MRMGLIGFAEETHLGNLLMTRNRHLRWERWPFAEADALWINGQHAQPLRNHMIRVPSGHPNKPAAVLNMREVDRPLAFTLPLGNGYLQPPESFDPRNAASVAAVLARFEEALMPLAVSLALAAELARRRHELSSPTYHLTVDGALVAVVNVAGDIGLAPYLTPVLLQQARWGGRPGAANVIPSGFETTSMARVMWQYAMRGAEDLLPARYRSALIYFRRMPAMEPRMLRDAHLLVLSELRSGPQTLAQLRQGTGMVDAMIDPVLAALYFAGAITLDPARAARGSTVQAPPEEWVTRPGHQGEPIPPRPGRRPHSEMPTIPTPLRGEGR